MKKILKPGMLLIAVISAVQLFSQVAILQSSPVTKQKLTIYPVPDDYRNYFFLQSIDDETCIVMSDFTGINRLIVLIQDNNNDGVADKVVDYYPDEKKFETGKKSKSQFFRENLNDLKKGIISGNVFRDYYTYKMRSLDVLELFLKKRINKDGTADEVNKYIIKKEIDGYKVIIFETDNPMGPAVEFYFAKIRGRYDLVCKTSFYKIFNVFIKPPLEYSVYCRNSSDPVVAETVESLLKLVGQIDL